VVGRRGSATLHALTALAVAALTVGGLVSLLLTATTRLGGYLAYGKDRETLRAVVEAAIAEMLADPTPQADGPGDPIWQIVPPVDGVSIEIRDASSALNPNYLRKTLLERSSWLAATLAPAATPASLQQDREDFGLSTDIEGRYGEFFDTDAFEVLTGHSFANVNTTDEFVLRWIVETRTGDPSAGEQFRLRIQETLVQRRVIDATELETMLGAHYALVSPLVTTEPQINVHFADPRVLRLLAAYPVHAITTPDARVDRLLSRRAAAELSPTDLAALFGVPPAHPLLQYLGVRTWFWEIVASTDRHRLDIIVARTPDAGAGDAPAYRVVEERYR
jgi:hypothetical protein